MASSLNRLSESIDTLNASVGSKLDGLFPAQLWGSSEMQRVSPKLAFFTYLGGNALDNANGDGIAKSLPQDGSVARWELRMSIAAALPSAVAESHVVEDGVHGDAFFCGIDVVCGELHYRIGLGLRTN